MEEGETVGLDAEGYPFVGAIEGMDADIVLLDNDLAIDTVIARGQLMMKDKQLRVRGTYE